jgi:hypothetical protein
VIPTASTQTISEFNGGAATETGSRTDCDWKAVDDSTTAASAAPISYTNNENSYSKYQALKFAGTWASISNVKVKIDNNAPATGLSIVGAVVASYTTPSRSSTGDSAMSTVGANANLVTSATPFGAGTSSSTASGTMYTQCVRTQLQTTSSFAGGPGAIATRTLTWSWTES